MWIQTAVRGVEGLRCHLNSGLDPSCKRIFRAIS